MADNELLFAYIGTNLVALVMLLVSWRWRTVGRLLYALMFAYAGQRNLRTAIMEPQEYVDYASLSLPGVYRALSHGFFASHVTAIIGAVAVGQLALAVLLALRGRAVRVGLVGAIVCLIAIAPLGATAAFPAPLLQALGAALLLRVHDAESLWSALRSRVLVHVRRAHAL